LKDQNFGNFSFDVFSDSADFEKYNSNVSPRDNIKKIVASCHEFIDNFDDPNQGNLLFCGSTGLGKTFLSSCIANELIKLGKVVVYETAPIMLDKIIDYKFGKCKDNIVDSVYSADLLIIDDLGTEAKSDLKLTELFNIINTRLLNQNNKITKTIISTNLSLQELYNTYEERIVSRIIGNYDACYFFGDDIRIKKKFALQ
jgi:DNA replication protein DnaC